MDSTLCNDLEAQQQYEIDYGAPRFHFPIPGQICYYIPVPEPASDVITVDDIILVKCIEEGLIIEDEDNPPQWRVPIRAQKLNQQTGKVAVGSDNQELPLLDVHVMCTADTFPIARPRFAVAKRICKKMEPSNAEILYLMTLANANFLDIRQELTQLGVQMRQYFGDSPETIQKL